MPPLPQRGSKRQPRTLWGLAFAILFGCITARAQLSLPMPKQYPQQRYKDHFHNADGSTRYSAELGAGPVRAMGPNGRFMNYGGVVEGALGLNFNKRVALQARGEYDRFAASQAVLVAVSQPSGRVEMTSGTVNLIARYHAGAHFLAYVTGGGGYFHKVTTFYTPTTATVCVGGGCDFSGGVPNAAYQLNTFGGGGGFGFEFKPSRFGNQKLFAEARYNFIKGQAPGTVGQQYPQNSANTEYLPLLFGLRW